MPHQDVGGGNVDGWGTGGLEHPDSPLAVGDDKLALEFEAGWLNDHPLTRADLEQEADYTRAAGFELDFT